MRVPRIYHSGELAPETTVALDERAARHVVQVLRLQPGAPLTLFNGRGGEYAARLDQAARRGAAARVLRHVAVERESPLTVVLGQCMARGPRMDAVIQKAVELGVAAIAPLTSRRCEVRLDGDREAGRVQHWEGVVISACEQCGRNRPPPVSAPRPLSEWLQDPATGEGMRLVLDTTATAALRDLDQASRVVLLSGPEGGLTEDEIAAAVARGFTAMRLGPRTLRAETAPLAAVAALQSLWGDG